MIITLGKLPKIYWLILSGNLAAVQPHVRLCLHNLIETQMQTLPLVHNFADSLTVEARVLTLLLQYWGDAGFADVTKGTSFHSRDVDYVYTPGRQDTVSTDDGAVRPAQVWVEIKADSTKYHNIFLELLSNGVFNVDTPGCFMFSQAYAWAYVFEDTKEMFVFDLHLVRAWVLANFKLLKPYLKTTTNKKADGSFAPTMGFAIPVEKFLGWLSSSVPMAYARLPGFGKPVDGAVPRPRLPSNYAHLDRGITGITELLDASPSMCSPTRVVQFRPESSPLRRHVLGIKHLALTQSRGIFESVSKRALGPHYDELMGLAAA